LNRGAGAPLKNWCAIEKCRRQPFIIKYHKKLLQALQAVFIQSCILQIILLKILLFHHKNFLKFCRTLWYNKPIIK